MFQKQGKRFHKAIAFALFFLVARNVHAYQYTLAPGESVCFYEDVLESDSLVGNFLALAHEKHPIYVQVQSPAGESVFESHELQGGFNLQVTTSGTYTMCFSQSDETARTGVGISFRWQSVLNTLGEQVAGKNFLAELESAARQEHVEHIVNEIRSLRRALLQIQSRQIFSRWLHHREIRTQRRTLRLLLYAALLKLFVLAMTSLEAAKSVRRRLSAPGLVLPFRGV
jgi:hypothetical protein